MLLSSVDTWHRKFFHDPLFYIEILAIREQLLVTLGSKGDIMINLYFVHILYQICILFMYLY